MTTAKLCGLLGMCRRSGRLVSGFDAVTALCETDGTLLMLAADASPRTVRELRFRAKRLQVYHLPLTKDEVAQAVGSSKPIACAATTDSGFACALRPFCTPLEPDHELEEESRYDD